MTLARPMAVTYSKAIQFLYDLRLFGAELGLENTRKLASLSGSPEKKLRFIHVAGTNGKGSTCAMLESIYRAAGLRVGLFTSPHLVAFGERIQVNRQWMSADQLIRQVSELQPLLKQFPANTHPTFFEVVTVMALRHFADQRCDLVIWETGMGGRLDATNIVTPLASVITNVDFDHQQWLGDTIEKIAFEKAGIIKPGVPVITATENRQALRVIADVAQRHRSTLKIVDADADVPPLDGIKLPLAGRHQRLNAALAVATVNVLSDQLAVGPDAIIEGLSTLQWPGRMQLVRLAGERSILLDGAHNKAGAEVLAHEFQKQFSGSRPALIFGVLRDKDWKSMAALLAPLASSLTLVPVKSERTLPPQEMVSMWQDGNEIAPVAVCASLAEALERVKAEPFVVITGSLYLVGEAMELLGLAVPPAKEERSLNEWVSPQDQGGNALRPPR
jgi:dihydrofolate synthase / folylpolyglutamate synthase